MPKSSDSSEGSSPFRSSIRSTCATIASTRWPCRGPRRSCSASWTFRLQWASAEKDLAKRFFILLHLFLKRKYEHVDIVFIRHTHEAAEVDEQEFFYGRETGGTAVSSALKTMISVRDARYPVADWNVYCAQASDGDNSAGDFARVRRAARQGDPAADAVLRLYRNRRRTRVGRRSPEGPVARLRRAQGEDP